jgi:Asp/Glu/hydantoin racemase
MMDIRILFIDPVGTDIYDEHMATVLRPQASPHTELVIRNLQGVPKTPFLPTPAAFYNQLFQTIINAEKEGFDGVVISCCSDPGLKDAKTLVNIPVTAPFEAAVRTAPALGRLSVIVPLIESGEGENLPSNANWARDLAREYGATGYIASVRAAPADHPSAEESMRLFAEDPGALRQLVLGGMERAVHSTALEQSKRAVYEDDATVLFYGCTFWGGMLGPIAQAVPAIILDPLVTPLKYIELLATAHKYYRRNISEQAHKELSQEAVRPAMAVAA